MPRLVREAYRLAPSWRPTRLKSQGACGTGELSLLSVYM